MNVSNIQPSVRVLINRIGDCRNRESIVYIFQQFFKNREQYSFSDQGFIITMIGLKMSVLDDAKHPSLLDVINEYNRSSLYGIKIPHTVPRQ